MISKVGPNHHDGLQENQVQYFLFFFFFIMGEWVATGHKQLLWEAPLDFLRT